MMTETARSTDEISSLAFYATLLVWSALLLTIAPTLFHIDDLFLGAWGGWTGLTGESRNPLLARQFPELTDLRLYTSLHMEASGAFYRIFGFNAASVNAYITLCMALTTLGLKSAADKSGASRLAPAIPTLCVAAFVYFGLRPEITACPLFAWGVSGVLSPDRRVRFLGSLLLTLAPLAAPAMLGVSGAVLFVSAAAGYRESRDWRVFTDAAVAVAASAVVLLALIDGQLSTFLKQFFWHASRGEEELAELNLSNVVRAAVAFGALAVIWRQQGSRNAQIILAGIGLGIVVSMFLHMKGPARGVVSGLALIIAAGGVIRSARGQSAAAAALAGIYLVFCANWLLFSFIQKPQPDQQSAVLAFVEKSRAEKKTILVDEVVAKYALDYQVFDMLAWTWSLRFPEYRPDSFKSLGRNDVWLISRHMALGYRNGVEFLKPYLRTREVPHRFAPWIGLCITGRVSCRLPLNAWDYLAFYRSGDGGVRMIDFVAGTEEIAIDAPPPSGP